MIYYYLSNRQSKELANGKVLRIALPYPDEGIRGAHVHHNLSIDGYDDAALVEWATDHLAVDVECDITLAELSLVPIDPLDRGGGGLGQVFGRIVSLDDPHPSNMTIRVLCVIVELAARRAPRAIYPTQWPARAERDDGRLIP